MINIEFESFEEIKEITKTVNEAVEKGLEENKKIVVIKVNGTPHTIDIECNTFKAGLLYGLSISKDVI